MRNLIFKMLRGWAERHIASREPSVVIGGAMDPYLKRWYVIPRNPIFNIYLHEMWRSDEDRALHDHPWTWASAMLRGAYLEQSMEFGAVYYGPGSLRIRRPKFAHRLIKVGNGEMPLTLFITGPRVREWGFHCPNGWRHWREFTDPATNGATVGRGCE